MPKRVMSDFIVVLFASLTGSMSFAGATVVGDGGTGLYCHDATAMPSMQVLETVEARTLFGREFQALPSPSQYSTFWSFPWPAGEVRTWDPRVEVESLLRDRLKGIIADTHPFWQSPAFDQLTVETGVVKDSYVLPADLWDTYAKYDASICDLRLLAIHWTQGVERPYGSDVQIDAMSFLLLSRQDQTVLMLHEALHGWFHIDFILNEERAVRELVVLLMASDKVRLENASQIRQIIETRDAVPLDSIKVSK